MGLARGLGRVALGCGALGIALASYSRWVETDRVQLEEFDVPLPSGSAGLDGVRLAFLTDTHVRSRSDFDRVVRAMDALEPADVLLIGGDLISDSARFVKPVLHLIQERFSRFPLGVFAVLGNHDYTVGADRVARDLGSVGVRVLRDRAEEVPWGETSFWVAGLDDALLASPDPATTMEAIPPDAFTVVLWHEPDWADEAANAGGSLQLSGHTHGGQVRLPWMRAFALPEGGRQYVDGWHQVGAMRLYVSRGLGTYRPPVRFRCSPEVTRLTLRAPR